MPEKGKSCSSGADATASAPARSMPVAISVGRCVAARHRLFACTNCGMAPMDRELALAKLKALAAGAALARKRYR